MSSISASETQRSQLSAIPELSDDQDFVLVKMNVSRTYTLAPGFPGFHGDHTHTKRELNHDLTVHISRGQDKDKMALNGMDGEFATVTVNLISQAKKPEDEELVGEDKDNKDNEEGSQPDQKVTEKAQEDDVVKYLEELEELEIEDYENESSKTKLLSVHSVATDMLASLALPNIFIPCPKCALQVNICHVRSHREFHAALKTLKFAINHRPRCLKTLIKRRKLLINRLLESGDKGFAYSNLQKINTAFEILKSELEGNGNSYRVLETSLDPKVSNVQGLDLCCTTAVGLCEESNSEWKNMEDASAYEDHYLEDIPCCFIGVYDGHCGNTTAQKCANHLHILLREKLQDILREEFVKLKSSKEKVASAFKQVYYDFQKMLVSTTEDEEPSRSRWSGCSALTCVLTEDVCCLANAGNVGALLIRDNAVVKVLTSKHDLYNKKERDRVRRSKGVIVKTEKCALINGALAATRGLGNIGDMYLHNCVINEPKFRFVELLPNDQIIVLASSGLWKMFSYEDTTNLVFGFFRKIKQDLRDELIYGDKIPCLTDEGRLESEYEEIYESLEGRHVYYDQFLRPQTTQSGRQSTVSFLLFMGISNSTENENVCKIHVSFKIPWWKKALGKRRMSDTCLSYQENVSHSNKNQEQTKEYNEDIFDENDEYESTNGSSYTTSFRNRRHSLPHQKGLKILHKVLKTDFKLTRKDKEKLLAQFLARRLVKSAVLAGSLDNLTVFVILLSGFSLVNVHTLTPQLLENLERPCGVQH